MQQPSVRACYYIRYGESFNHKFTSVNQLVQILHYSENYFMKLVRISEFCKNIFPSILRMAFKSFVEMNNKENI